jgi:hypothetical protein
MSSSILDSRTISCFSKELQPSNESALCVKNGIFLFGLTLSDVHFNLGTLNRSAVFAAKQCSSLLLFFKIESDIKQQKLVPTTKIVACGKRGLNELNQHTRI